MTVSLVVPPTYGLMGIIAALSALMNGWMSLQVGLARRKYNVPLPNAYADKEHPQATEFNCVQRAHQNCLESLAVFYSLLVFGGLQHPWITFGFALFYLAARVVYFIGYSSGKPENRVYGLVWNIGMLGMLGTTISFAVQSLMQA